MKNAFITIAAMAVCVLPSCNKITEEIPEKGLVTLEISTGDSPQTKSTSVASETAVNKIEVLVFNSAGALDGYAKLDKPTASATYTVPVNCSLSTGMTVCAFTNSAKDITAKTYTEYQATISSLKDNSLSAFQMAGVATGVDLKTKQSASVSLDRFVAKVQIDKITNDFLHSLTVTGIYLVNVNPTCPYSMEPTTAAASDWINQRTYTKSAADALVYESLSETITSGSSLSESHYFYTYPNPVTSDTSDAESSYTARCTRLVVQATLDEKTTYYPINIVGSDGNLASNTLYRITNLKISGPGSDSPDVLPSRGSVSVSITITDWKTGFSKEVTY